MKINNKTLVAVLTIVYFVSYITRINYAAVLLEIVQSTALTRETASYAVTGLAIFYGAGQLLSGFLGDIIRPKYLIAAGLFVTSVANAVLPFSVTNHYFVTAVWCINGLAQAMMWPPIVKIFSVTMDSDEYKKACVKISYGSATGTMAVYLLAPVCIRLSGWHTVFFVSAALAAVSVFAALFFLPDVDPGIKRKVSDDNVVGIKTYGFPYIMFVLILVAIALHGAMRDGVTTWMPSYISESFGLGNDVAILTCVAMPLFSLFCYEAASLLNRKLIKNELVCAAAIFGAAFVCAFLLSLFSTKSVVLSVILSTIITGSMHGVNVILICLLPPYFKKSGRVSFISGILNSFTYLGSALSGYGFAVLSEKLGWSATVVSWSVIGLVGTIICFCLKGAWAKYISE